MTEQKIINRFNRKKKNSIIEYNIVRLLPAVRTNCQNVNRQTPIVHEH